MRYLFDKKEDLAEDLRGRDLMLFLDYDGTLAPIADTPQKAIIPAETRELLFRLSKNKRFRVAIMSGRSLRDIKKRVGLKGIIYAGNHGLEIGGPKINFKSPVSAGFKAVLKKIKRDLAAVLGTMRGVLIEDKGLTLSVHYRLAPEKDGPAVKNLFYEIVGPYRRKNTIDVKYGKKVFEIRPHVNWDKGKAALWLLAREKFMRGVRDILPVYIGDDLTDEDAFKRLKKKGVTIFVGPPKISRAEYYLNDTREVVRFLNNLLKSRKE